MSKNIDEDHEEFRKIIGGKIRKELKKFINNGSIFRLRGDGKRIKITIPKIDNPHIVFGDNDEGIGRGKGEKGKVIKKDPQPGDESGKDAGEEHQDGIQIGIDLEDVFKFLKDELALPDLLPKANQTFEEVIIKYNNISKTGPESLRHNRRTMLQALKRMAASGELNKLHLIPGYSDPMKLITPINSDRRYRQYREIKIPSSNAVVFYARDGSGSMDAYKCDIVSDMAWWIDAWIRRFYKKVESRYVWHDTQAEIMSQKDFYATRFGGGTMCSSSLNLIRKQIAGPNAPFPPSKWNIYILYFGDGENFGDDNKKFNKIIKEQFPPNIVNMVGVTQILAWNRENSLKQAVDKYKHHDNVRTTEIGAKDNADMPNGMANFFYGSPQLTEDERNEQIMNAIIDLLGNKKKKKTGEIGSSIKKAS